ncbi:SpoIIE family protein phosphatase [Streptomyces sp. NPDC051917]|uniref:SpoIIE family protein phosphatase n=1 Tax=Streptomyces sp. NPDC051917 TaxID=3154754 RepID=UPI0034547ABE
MSQRVVAAAPPVRNARSRSARPSAGRRPQGAEYPPRRPSVSRHPPGLYTDGLIEIPGSDHETALADLAAALSKATGPLDDVADTRLAHAQPSGDRADDTALLLVKIY